MTVRDHIVAALLAAVVMAASLTIGGDPGPRPDARPATAAIGE